MCGITGIYAKNMVGKMSMINLSAATDKLEKRGPDARGVWMNDFVGLGHRRLSVLDTSYLGAQPMKDVSGRYTLVYNGEIYNYQKLRNSLEQKGYKFKSGSDTEVLLYAYIQYKEKCLSLLNGFFAFAIYDEKENSIFIARDRFGIKPLYYYNDEDKFIFASDMHSVLAYGIAKELNYESLLCYLQLNYTPAPETMIRGINMLMPGHFAKIKDNHLDIETYYQIDYHPENPLHLNDSYEKQQKQLRYLIDDSVRNRLVSDVPLGTFLSGGIDSSLISGIAKKYKDDLHTFSIGYRDEPFFDETHYADLVAKKFRTEHTVFSLTNDDLHRDLFDILDRMDQPFADSSAIPTYILSKKTKEHVTVALSGDGADELFSGYNKHSAHLRAMSKSGFNTLIKAIGPALKYIPKSGNGYLLNKIRQADKFSRGLKLKTKDRYWEWASLTSEGRAQQMLSTKSKEKLHIESYRSTKSKLLETLSSDDDFNELLLTDMQLVLANDMLRKVDLMSMSHGLEVRVPFLDHQIVDYVFQLPVSSKINPQIRKRILQDAFRDLLPEELYNRPKKGFEVPLLKWFRSSLQTLITDDLLKDQFIEEQGIFDPAAVRALKKRLFSVNPGNAHATVWALIVFQWWWKKYFSR